MIATLILAANLLFPDPNSPDIKTAFDKLHQDFATCNAYYTFKDAWYTIADPQEKVKALGGMVSASYEGHRLEGLAGLPTGTFEMRAEAMKADMLKTLDKHGFGELYSQFDGFCESLRDDTGKHFLRHLPKNRMKG